MRLKRMVLTAGTLALLVVAVAAIAPDLGGTVAHAQAPTPTVVVVPTTVPLPPPVTRVEQDNSGRWGLLGLLGLAGLAGLLKRPQTEVRTVETQRVATQRVEPPHIDPPRTSTR